MFGESLLSRHKTKQGIKCKGVACFVPELGGVLGALKTEKRDALPAPAFSCSINDIASLYAGKYLATGPEGPQHCPPLHAHRGHLLENTAAAPLQL